MLTYINRSDEISRTRNDAEVVSVPGVIVPFRADSKDKISPNEMARRAKAVASANASLRFEGFEVDEQVAEINKRFIAGEISSQEQIELVKAMYVNG